ncbi:MAG TPA: hypothetical protein VLH86_02360 [Patescibacteria group bacterium]|nr:hypothetical protein [Patescibacteria group bacterium]
MPTYTFETQVNTSQSILMMPDGIADSFTVKEYTFKSSKLDFDNRPGYRYFVERTFEAANMHEAYDTFLKRLIKITDAMAYFYSQPVNVEYWNMLIKKEGEGAAYFSAHRLRPATSMSDYNSIDERLIDLIDKSDEDDDLENSLWIYNNVATVDSVDYDPSALQFGLCQLVESLSDTEDVPKCKACGLGGHKKTSRPDMKALLGASLYKKLYGGSDILRNRLGHGRLVGGKFLTHQDTEDIVLKVTERLNAKYGVWNKVNSGMTDRIRGVNVWNGTAYGIDHKGMGLEECLKIQFDDELRHVQKPLRTKEW